MNRKNIVKNTTKNKKTIKKDYKIIVGIKVKLLNRTLNNYYDTSQIKINNSIAIVGNSINILNKKYGNEIDAHDEVVRFNWVDTKNIKEYTGSKQTIRFCNIDCITGIKNINHPKGLIQDYNMYKKFRNLKIIVINRNRAYDPIKLNLVAKKCKINKTNKLFPILWSEPYFNNILTRLKIPYKLSKIPQKGLGAILILCNLNYKPDVYGFDIKYDKSNYGYPWTQIKHTKLSKFHNLSQEHQILIYMNEHKLINIIN